MMKKLLAFLLALALLPACALGESFDDKSREELARRIEAEREKPSVLYENSVLGYRMLLPATFLAATDLYCQQRLQAIKDESIEGDDTVYDLRLWGHEDGDVMFEVQLKECTNESFEAEVAAAPDYAQLLQADALAHGDTTGSYSTIHDGILRDTPMGQMLEMAYVYSQPDAETGEQLSVYTVYYDFYYNTIEYCFVLSSMNTPYAQMQAILDGIMQTVAIDSVIQAV